MMFQIDGFDFPDTVGVPDDYGITQVPEATKDNMMFLVGKLNDMIVEINKLKEAK